MRIVLGSRGDYSVRAVLHLARHPGRQRRQDIAAAMDIPDKFLPQILAALVRARVVRSTTGRLGGHELARRPEAITLREVVEIAEGPIRSQKCIMRNGPCYWGDKCGVHDAWAEAETALVDRLDSTTFADLARADWELEQVALGATSAARRGPRLHRPDHPATGPDAGGRTGDPTASDAT